MSAKAIKDDVIQEDILRAALQLYRKYGPGKVTMDDVANATGRSRTSLYYYFKNRDEIFYAVTDTIVSDIAKEIRKAVAEASTLADKLYAFCATKIKTSVEWVNVFTSIWAAMDADEQTTHHKAKDALHKKLVHQEGIILHEIISGAAAQKQIRTVNPEQQDMLVFLIYTGIRGLRREVYDLSDPHDIKVAMRLLADMVVKWLKD